MKRKKTKKTKKIHINGHDSNPFANLDFFNIPKYGINPKLL